MANAVHIIYSELISKLIDESAKTRGTGIARRSPAYIKEKILSGNSIIAVNKNEFVEYEVVYPNIFYGTLKSKINSLLKQYNVIFDVDVVGGQSLKKFFTSNSLSIFINPPSINELENRLRKRKNNSDYEINERLYKAKKEMEMKDQFDINIVNENLNISKTKIFKIVNNFIES